MKIMWRGIWEECEDCENKGEAKHQLNNKNLKCVCK